LKSEIVEETMLSKYPNYHVRQFLAFSIPAYFPST
jgi:hypothetical protein